MRIQSNRFSARKLVLGTLTLLVLGALWAIATGPLQWVGPARLPPPAEVWAALNQILVEGYGDGTLLQHVLHSLRLVALGFTVAVAVGVPLGLAMGHSRKVEAFVNPTFLLLRPVPPLAWIPLAIVWLGLGDAAKLMVIFVAAFVPSVINTYTGVRQIERPQMEAARMLGIGPWRLTTQVLVPGALPHIFSGLRLSLQASWTTLVAGELIGAAFGLGKILNQAAQDIYPAMVMVAMATVALCGGLTTLLLARIETWAMPWKRR
jgi:taurine transport system permease protein